jgi:hypothetical protein
MAMMTRSVRILGMAWLVGVALGTSFAQPPTSLPPPVNVSLIEPPPPPPELITYTTDTQKIGDLLTDGEYLLLAPRRPAQTFAIVGSNPNWGPIGIIRSVDGNYDSGFRVGAGWRFVEEECDVMARYTYYHTAADDIAGAPPGGKVFATLTHPSTVMEVQSAVARNSVNFNLFDLEIGRRFDLGETLDLRVFAGPRYANVDQKLTVQYAGGDVITDDVHHCLCFDGAGLRAGGETHWRILQHLGVYLRGSASLLTGRFCALRTETANGFAIVDISENYTRVIPMFDLGVGLSFQKGNWRVSAGYEFMNWFNMVDGTDFVDDAHPAKLIRPVGSLGFDGVVFRAEVSF